MRDFVPEYHGAKFGGNWTKNKGETEGEVDCIQLNFKNTATPRFGQSDVVFDIFRKQGCLLQLSSQILLDRHSFSVFVEVLLI